MQSLEQLKEEYNNLYGRENAGCDGCSVSQRIAEEVLSFWLNKMHQRELELWQAMEAKKEMCANHTLDESYCLDCCKSIKDERTHAWQYSAGIAEAQSLLSTHISKEEV